MDRTLAHSPLGASAAHRWSRCPGSVHAIKRFHDRHPDWDDTSPSSLEGTEAHGLAELLLNGEDVPDHPDREMLRHALNFRDYCIAHSESAEHRWVESTVSMPMIHEAAFGTVDYACYNPSDGTCHVIDFKYGQGVAVAAQDNEQLIEYAEGIRELLSEQNLYPQRYVLHIMQPRVYDGISAWVVTPQALRVEVARLHKLARETETKPDHYNPGTKQCRWCVAKADCLAYVSWVHGRYVDHLDEMDHLMREIKNNTLSDADLGVWIERFEEVHPALQKLKSLAYHRAVNGRKIPGKKLIKGKATYRCDEQAVRFVLGGLAEKPVGVLSKSELIKRIGRARFEQSVADYYTREEGRPMLVDASDPRPTYTDTTDVRDMFD